MTTSEATGPLDVDALTRLANELFAAAAPYARGAPASASIPGAVALPPPAPALVPPGPGTGPGAAVPVSVPGPFGAPPLGYAAPPVAAVPGAARAAPARTQFPADAAPRFYFEAHLGRVFAGGIAVPGTPAPPAPGAAAAPAPPLDVHAIRRDFPILAERVNGRPLVWLDNAATTQKPRAVIDRLARFYETENSNIHRAAHELAARATDAYEDARAKVARFLNAGSPDEIVFVRGATEGINLVAKSWGAKNIGADDEILVTHLEHHANIVPWQQLCEATGARLRVAPVDSDGQVDLDAFAAALGPRTKLVAFSQVSNALGTVVPAAAMAALARAAGAKVLIDGAQSVSHMRVDVRALDADWFVFSGHKVFGPTGIGAVYGKKALLDAAPPWQGGGNMIRDVRFEKTEYHDAPARFEAGTGNIADAVGLGAALDYVGAIGLERIEAYEHGLLEFGTRALAAIPGVRLIGTAKAKASVLSFVVDGLDPVEIGKALNREGIAVRAGHHCAQPILRRFGLEATVRPSLAFYNTCAELDALAAAVRRIVGPRAVR